MRVHFSGTLAFTALRAALSATLRKGSADVKLQTLALITAIVCLSGCILSVRGGFSPVQGPLSQQSPIPTYNATLTGVLSGTITVVVADGEVCKGPWHFVSTASSAPSDVNPASPSSSAIAADWDMVFGRGYYVAHVLGNRLYARATLTGNRGTSMDVEVSNENNTRGNTRGIAVDDHGNLYKVSVYN
jgi:hypothetical protein